MATATIEADDTFAAFAEMQPAEREAFVDSLHKDLATEKAGDKAAEEKVPAAEQPAPGKTRDEIGRYAPKQDDTSARDDETPVVDDAGKGAKPDTEEAVDDWRSAEVKGLAAQYGLDEEALAEIPSREVLDVALRAIDKKAFEAAAAKPAQPAKVKADQKVDDAFAVLDAFALDDELGADDAPKIRDAIKAITAELKQQRSFRETERQQVLTARWGQEYDASLKEVAKELGIEDLLKDPKNQQKVLDAHLTHIAGLRNLGRLKMDGSLHITPALVRAAVNQQFAEDIVKTKTQQQLSRLRQQSSKRTGGGTTKLPPLPKNATPLERNLREASENWKRAHGDD
jgi:hypothetical protein